MIVTLVKTKEACVVEVNGEDVCFVLQHGIFGTKNVETRVIKNPHLLETEMRTPGTMRRVIVPVLKLEADVQVNYAEIVTGLNEAILKISDDEDRWVQRMILAGAKEIKKFDVGAERFEKDRSGTMKLVKYVGFFGKV